MRVPFVNLGLQTSYRCCDRLLFTTAMFAAACLFAAMSVIVIDILTRRSIDLSIVGSVDLTQLFVMACAFLAMPFAFVRDAHVSVEFVTDVLPPRLVLVTKALAATLSCAFMFAVLISSYEQASLQIGNGDRSQTIGIPIAAFWAPLLAGMGLSALATMMIALRNVWVALGRPDCAVCIRRDCEACIRGDTSASEVVA